MQRLTRALAALAVATLGLPASAGLVTYTAALSGPAEAPPNASPGTGSATVILDDVTLTMRVIASFSGLIGTTTAAHIHCCTAVAATGTAGVATVTPSFTGFPLGVTAGSYDHTFDMSVIAGSWNAPFVNNNGGLASTAFSALMTGLETERAYFNVHTSTFGGGEIRGFLVQAVPEPASLGLAVAALLAAGWARRRRAA